MSRRPTRDSLPGNDGRWFLELVGVVEPDAQSSDSYATLERLVPPPQADDTSTMNTGAVAVAVNGALAAGAGPEGAPTPPELGIGLDRRRRRRWSWLILPVAAVLVAAGATAALSALPRAVEDDAARLADRYRDALSDMRSELPETQRALADLTDPTAAQDSVSAVPVAIADLALPSAKVQALATTPLPSTLPLVSPVPFERLEPTRTSMNLLGAAGGDLSERLGVAFTYRTAIRSMFAVDTLPTAASNETITQLSLALATDLAATGRLVADLPPDPAFGDVRDAAVTASERYATWQLEYLEALRDGDQDRAGEVIGELDAVLADLGRLLNGSLAAIRIEVDAALVELASELERAIAEIPGRS